MDGMSLLLFPILPARAMLLEHTADMPWMIRNPENLLQNGRDPLDGPVVVGKAKGRCPMSNERWDLSQLFVRQRCLPTRSGLVAQGLDTAPFAQAFEPLANCTLRDTQCLGDSLLRPAQFM